MCLSNNPRRVDMPLKSIFNKTMNITQAHFFFGPPVYAVNLIVSLCAPERVGKQWPIHRKTINKQD